LCSGDGVIAGVMTFAKAGVMTGPTVEGITGAMVVDMDDGRDERSVDGMEKSY
jgi:hypothetical protein